MVITLQFIQILNHYDESNIKLYVNYVIIKFLNDFTVNLEDMFIDI